ncbi:AfsR/SARP family transcriptional regulator [Yinghuangia seranimata]|uniref:AfsR/SARP family transcriptional regulator n=1 Tax=Yinghuangia seranimata TaxID=408067 RepID=UPI00248AB97E|nr:AfsR/SARP family transcriptional regulator [Yinghuangia seranimata]MDI2131476.1 AfsR/SARP family transcriptional regulator [Yinghuangia seranimata]
MVRWTGVVGASDGLPGAGVGVLGPLEVRGGDGAWAPVSGVRPRSLLARLTAAAGRVVLTERLLSEVWPGETPATRAKAVAQVVHRLRRLLGDRDGVLIATRPQGYELRLPGVEVDAVIAGLLVEQGRARLACGDPEAASALLGEALALWRGEPYDGVEFGDPAGLVACHSAQLARLRVSALEARIDADLVLERHRGVVDELAGLVERDPLHEPWWPRLMLALHGCGRRADALYTYQRLRALLVDGLGIEPGPEARRVHALGLGGVRAGGPAGRGCGAAGPASGGGSVRRRRPSTATR